MSGITERLGGRKFAAFVTATIALIALYAFGLELSEDTLDAITTMYLAFAGGNGIEHIATSLGSRTEKPDLGDLPGDIVEAVRDALTEDEDDGVES